MKWESRIVEFNGDRFRIHLIVEYNPKVQISKYVNNLKTVSSRLICQEFAAELKQVLLQARPFNQELTLQFLVAALLPCR